MVDLEALKRDLEAAGWVCSDIVDDSLIATAHVDHPHEIVMEICSDWDGFFVRSDGENTIPFSTLDIIRRHVAPPEPVVLTEEERQECRDAIWDAEIEYEKQDPPGDRGYRDVAIDATIAWLAANGFALVRTKAVADGA